MGVVVRPAANWVERARGLVLILLLLGAGLRSTSVARAQRPDDVPVRLPGHVLTELSRAAKVTPAGAPHGAAAIRAGSPAGNQPITLTIVLKRSDEQGFENYLKSAGPGGFMSQDQLTARFGPSQQAYDAVLAYMQQSGFALSQGSTNRLTLTVTGSRAQAEQAFNVDLEDYQLDGKSFYANDQDPAVPGRVGKYVQAVVGLSNLSQPATPTPSLGGLGTALGLVAVIAIVLIIAWNIDRIVSTISCALQTTRYNMQWWAYQTSLASNNYGGFPPTPPTWPAECGPNPHPNAQAPRSDRLELQTGGLGDLDRADPGGAESLRAAADIGAHAPLASASNGGAGQTIGLLEFDTFRMSDVTDWLTFTGLPSLHPNQLTQKHVNGGVASPGGGEPEVLLDIDTVIAIAPSANYVVYDSPVVGSAATSFTTVLNAMINDGVSVISNSWTACEDQMSLADVQSVDNVLKQAAAAGISVINATGDNAGTCSDGTPNTIAVPADSPNATAVGATTIQLGQGITYGSESLWPKSGFGVSRYFPAPPYQPAAAMRSVPDATIPADPAQGMTICEADAGGCPNGATYGGTSMSAPAWAAVAALLDTSQGHLLGNLNPILYGLANANTFHSPASMGTDPAHAGIGTPDLDKIVLALGQTAGPADVNNSVVSVQPESVPADGHTQAIIQVNLLDANGHWVSGDAVSLSQGGGHSIISAASGPSDVSSGAVIFTVTDTTPETVTYTASANGVALTATGTVTFSSVPGTGCQPSTPSVAAGYAFSIFAAGFPTNNFQTGCLGTIGIAFDSASNAYVSVFPTGMIYKFPPGGGVPGPGTQLTQHSLGFSLDGLVFGRDGRLYAARESLSGAFTGDGDVIEVDPATGALVREVAKNLSCPAGLAIDPISGDLFVSEPCPSGSANILRIVNPSAAAPAVTVYSSPGFSAGMAFATDGTLFTESFRFTDNTRHLVRIAGTNSATPGAFTDLMLVSHTSGVAIPPNPANPGQPPYIFGTRDDGFIVKYDLSALTETDVFTGGGTMIFGNAGPDGCLYASWNDAVVRLRNADGSCPLAPASGPPQLSLSPAAISPNPSAGTVETFTAALFNVSAPGNTQVTFTVIGANPQTAVQTATTSGVATFSYAGVDNGLDTIRATATAGGTPLTSNTAAVTWVNGKDRTFVTLDNSAKTGQDGVPVNLAGTLQDVSVSPPVALANQPITLGLGGQSCNATTDANGSGSCGIVPNESPGSYPLTATFVGSSKLAASSASDFFLVLGGAGTPSATIVSYTGPTTLAGGSAASLSGKLAITAGGALSGESLSFTLGSGGGAQTCTGTTDTSGAAACVITSVNQPAGSDTVAVGFIGDNVGGPASTTASVTITKQAPTLGTTLSATSITTGAAVHDSATLTGATASAGGTVTYNAYTGTACAGTPAFTSQVAVSGGSVPSSAAFTPVSAGTYNWQAVYSGDRANMSATSLCGTETLTVTAGLAGKQGCSPGFWKNHPNAWVGYQPNQTVGILFNGVDSSLSASTLQAALDFKGGSSLAGAEQTLLRSAVAGLLNASNPSVQYALTPSALISQVNAALAQSKRDAILTLAASLDADNNGTGGCPMS